MKNLRFLRRAVLILALSLALFGTPHQAAQAVPDGGWIPAGEAPWPAHAQISELEESRGFLLAGLEIPGVWAETQTLAAGAFTRLELPGAGRGAEPGLPDLPVIRRWVEVPPGAVLSLSLVDARQTEVSLPGLGYPDPVVPLQPSQPKCGGPLTEVPCDPRVYEQDAFFPAEPVRIAAEAELRGRRLVQLEFWPLAYNPMSGRLRLYASLQVRLGFEGGTAAPARLDSVAFGPVLEAMLLNPPETAGWIQTVPNYLIIAADAYAAGLEDFINLKESQGYNVTLATLAQTGSSKEQIKAFIQGQYNSAAPPDYLLLVGDSDTIPVWPMAGESTYTDLYYATMGGADDYVPDIYHGRFPVRSAAQLENMLDNLLSYEALSGSEDWVKKAAFLATDDAYNYDIAEATHNYVINNYTGPLGYSGSFPIDPQPGGDKLYAITYGADGSDALTALNAGRGMVVYSGHGSALGWAGPNIDRLDVQGLARLHPYVAGHACLTADFRVSEAVGDTWVIQPGKGALVYVGASNYSYWYEDDALERKMFDVLFADAEAVPTVGQMLHAGLAEVSLFSYMDQYYWEEYQILGDPSLQILTSPRQVVSRLELNPADASGVGPVGGVVSHALSLTNTGVATCTADISASGHTWDVQITPPSQLLTGGQSAAVNVQVSIPAGAAPGTQDSATIRAVCREDNRQTASAEITSAARLYAASLSGANAVPAASGGLAQFTVTLTNTGNGPDTFSLELVSPAGWSANPPASPVILAAGQSQEIVLSVEVPAEAVSGRRHALTLTAVSQGSPDVQASRNLFVTVLAERTYLPMLGNQ